MLRSEANLRFPRRSLTIALACVVALGALAFAADMTTLRLEPGSQLLHSDSRTAFVGELIEVQLASRFTPPMSSDPGVVAPIGGGWFVAASLGKATLSAHTIRYPGEAAATFLWRVEVDVHPPGL